MNLVYFSHGLIEDGGDNAAMGMSRWPCVAPSQPEPAEKPLGLLIVGESEVHPFGIVFAASETVVLLLATDVSAAHVLLAHRERR